MNWAYSDACVCIRGQNYIRQEYIKLITIIIIIEVASRQILKYNIIIIDDDSCVSLLQ